MGPPSFKCNCYAYLNLYIEKYGYHFRYFNHQKFLEDYQEMLSAKNCSSEEINQISQSLKQLQDDKKAEDDRAFERFQKIRSLYKPLHSKLFTFNECYLDPSFKELVSQCRNQTSSTSNSSIKHLGLSEEVDVYKFKVFTPEFISLLLQEVEHISNFPGLTLGRPNSMNYNGVLMKELGLDEFLTVLREEYLQPIVDAAFPHIGDCDSHRAFTVKYNADGNVQAGDGDRHLGLHYDNAEVTINVCLQADNCQGSDLKFLGIADGTPISEEELESDKLHVVHEVGQGVFHLGRQRHYVTPITQGVRTNLVMWLRSSSVRNLQCPMCWEEPEMVQTKFFDDGFRP